ncbi:MAG: hypothetical protein Q8910_03680, partial [Bacteroidota bacterium]|nr:hypothetical protein [Bacteroidota bacterium]
MKSIIINFKQNKEMRKNYFSQLLVLILITVFSCSVSSQEYKTISPDVLKDKIAGGWAGKMIGVTYGAPVEFKAMNHIFTDPINWKPSDI